MTLEKSLHSICRWTFNSGKGGFVPADARPSWGSKVFRATDMIDIITDIIKPKLPDHVELGVELHYDNEIDEKSATNVATALQKAGIALAMITPGAHVHFGYGGIASLNEKERTEAELFGTRTLDLAYGPLQPAWSASAPPTLVLWNGSWGYDLATPTINMMYSKLQQSIANLSDYEEEKGGRLYIGIEPKPNEGHPALLLPTVASALLFWNTLAKKYGMSPKKKGVNLELGHSEMIGLDAVYDVAEILDNDAMVHIHLNSQGYNDGITLGGPGKYDIDHGVKINGMNIAIARLMQNASFDRWKGHDMQTRPYDNITQGIDRVVRSILSWEACEAAARELDTEELYSALAQKETGVAEDIMRHAVVRAHNHFDEMYQK